jgi:Effector-associated domain 7
MNEQKYNLGVIRDLIDKALGDEELNNLCFDEFKLIYSEVESRNRGDKIRYLVEYIERQMEMKKLLRSIEKSNPNRYREYEHKICNSPAPINRQHQRAYKSLPAVSNFDLKNTIDPCMRVIMRGKPGLSGRYISCNNDLFLDNFRKRLQNELRGRNTEICDSITLNYHHTAKLVAKQVINKQKILKVKDVVYPILIDRSVTSSSIVEFWTEIDEFFAQVELGRRLTIVMFGDRDCIFPSHIQPLAPPHFTSMDAFYWIRDITQALGEQTGWVEVQDKWIENIKECCPCEHSDFLDVGSAYRRLNSTFSFIREKQEKQESISPQDFLAYLES